MYIKRAVIKCLAMLLAAVMLMPLSFAAAYATDAADEIQDAISDVSPVSADEAPADEESAAAACISEDDMTVSTGTDEPEPAAGTNIWVNEDGNWYYINDKGKRSKGWKKLRLYGDENEAVRWCWFDGDGVLQKDISKNTAKKWVKAGGKKYWFTKAKKPASKGFRLINGKVYYLDKKGAMVKGKFKVGKKTYKTKKDGSLTGLIYYKVKYKTFVLIDISEQKLRFYRSGKLKLKANVVTGHKGLHDTPTGITKVMGKARNVNLTGSTWNVMVSYWMPFRTGGYGMHDATWRSAAQINSRSTYLHNGSHGCVNMKKGDAASLYNKVKVGTTVIVCR